MRVSRKPLRCAILRFPCSNCDFDTLRFFTKHGHTASFVWYREKALPPCDLVVIPGGFAFGDRVYAKATGDYTVDPGTSAASSPIVAALRELCGRVPVLGICNGFQVLVKTHLLPGALRRNTSKRFFCDTVSCRFRGASFFNDTSLLGKTLTLPVAHEYGRYVVSDRTRKTLLRHGQVFLTYVGKNPNGSVGNIAGVCNRDKTVFGMMPHPERSCQGETLIRSLERYVRART